MVIVYLSADSAAEAPEVSAGRLADDLRSGRMLRQALLRKPRVLARAWQFPPPQRNPLRRQTCLGQTVSVQQKPSSGEP